MSKRRKAPDTSWIEMEEIRPSADRWFTLAMVTTCFAIVGWIAVIILALTR